MIRFRTSLATKQTASFWQVDGLQLFTGKLEIVPAWVDKGEWQERRRGAKYAWHPGVEEISISQHGGI